ncbi:uncharacterized protein [Haliotis cracherodii]|uniref:uncharacterized protein n=1 Tax=Haliotis cracherodii TaxID=6455 RepID=UPI0039EC7BB8
MVYLNRVFAGALLALCVCVGVEGQFRRTPRMRYETPCQYLTSRPTLWPENSAPFELSSRGLHNDVRRGKPIEVRIHQWENSIYSFENFTDFVIYAEPAVANAEVGAPWRPVGVFSIYPQYASGGVGFRCNRGAQGYDAVGSVEERHLEVYRMRYPNDPNLRRYTARQRKSAAFIWFPSEGAMKSEKIVFVALVKIKNEWFRLTSRPWTVYNPPTFWQTFNQQMTQVQRMRARMTQAERQAAAAEAQAAAAAA